MVSDSRTREERPFVALIDNHHHQAQHSRGSSPTALKQRSGSYSIIQLHDLSNPNANRQYLTNSSSSMNLVVPQPNKKGGVTASTTEMKTIYEIQTLPHSTSEDYSSFFVGSRVISNPSLHLISRVDPLYLLLSYFESEVQEEHLESGKKERKNVKAKTFTWQPWNQICQSKNIHPSIQQVLKENKSQLKHFFQVNDSFGSNDNGDQSNDGENIDDLILFKFSSDKVLKWLKRKIKSVESILEKQSKSRRSYEQKIKKDDERNRKRNGGAFSSSFILPSTSSSSSSNDKKSHLLLGKEQEQHKDSTDSAVVMSNVILTKEDQQMISRSSIQIICEYISPSWQKRLIHALDLKMTDVFESSKSSSTTIKNDQPTNFISPQNKNQPTPMTVTPTSRTKSITTKTLTEADKLLQYTTGGGGGSGKDNHDEDENKKKRKIQGAQSVGLKKLQKVNTKGMKSLASFFGPATSSKKKKNTSK